MNTQSRSLAVNQLTSQLQQCESWAEVEPAITAFPEYKTDAWQRLDAEEKSRLRKLKTLAEVQATESEIPAPEDAQMFRVDDRNPPSHEYWGWLIKKKKSLQVLQGLKYPLRTNPVAFVYI